MIPTPELLVISLLTGFLVWGLIALVWLRIFASVIWAAIAAVSLHIWLYRMARLQGATLSLRRLPLSLFNAWLTQMRGEVTYEVPGGYWKSPFRYRLPDAHD